MVGTSAFHLGHVELKCLRWQEVVGDVDTMRRREIIPGDLNMAVNGIYIKSESMGISKIIKR